MDKISGRAWVIKNCGFARRASAELDLSTPRGVAWRAYEIAHEMAEEEWSAYDRIDPTKADEQHMREARVHMNASFVIAQVASRLRDLYDNVLDETSGDNSDDTQSMDKNNLT